MNIKIKLTYFLFICNLCSISCLALDSDIFSQANEAKKIAAKNECITCHAPNKNFLGPSHENIAKKYSNKQHPEEIIVKCIKFGSRGKYGAVPMPASKTYLTKMLDY